MRNTRNALASPMPVQDQLGICKRWQSPYCATWPQHKIGIAVQTLRRLPINGLRHHPESETCGWYIWGGEELSDAPDFFSPMHVTHLPDHLPIVIPYLGLAPGYRFLLTSDYEDVWFDANLLDQIATRLDRSSQRRQSRSP